MTIIPYPFNLILDRSHIEAACQTIAEHRILTDFNYWDDEDEEIITRHDVEETLRQIAIACSGTSFTDFVMSRQISTRRLSDHLLLDLKYDDTLPESFDNLDQFRSYLRTEGACIRAMRQARPVWKRYQYWLARRAAS
jgi:uncharacterized protein YozE (UPF0346 family)